MGNKFGLSFAKIRSSLFSHLSFFTFVRLFIFFWGGGGRYIWVYIVKRIDPLPMEMGLGKVSSGTRFKLNKYLLKLFTGVKIIKLYMVVRDKGELRLRLAICLA